MWRIHGTRDQEGYTPNRKRCIKKYVQNISPNKGNVSTGSVILKHNVVAESSISRRPSGDTGSEMSE